MYLYSEDTFLYRYVYSSFVCYLFVRTRYEKYLKYLILSVASVLSMCLGMYSFVKYASLHLLTW
jgi:hypothetical protein